MERHPTVLDGAKGGDTLLIETESIEIEIEVPDGLSQGDEFAAVLADEQVSQLGDAQRSRAEQEFKAKPEAPDEAASIVK